MTRCAPSPRVDCSTGYVTDDLAAHGIGFSLFDMPALAALAARIVVEEQTARRPMTVVITPAAEDASEGVHDDAPADLPSGVAPVDVVIARPPVEPIRGTETPVRLVAVPAGA